MKDAAIALAVTGMIVVILFFTRTLLSGRKVDAAAEADFGEERRIVFNRTRVLTGILLIFILSFIVLRLGSCLDASLRP